MAVRSVKNQYRGINAHLHSLWQGQGGWQEFHTRHIVKLADALKPLLLPLGYTAAIEASLQIRRIDPPGGTQYPESDITIYDLQAERPARQTLPTSAAGELTLPLVDAVLSQPISEHAAQAIKIYERSSKQGEPVVWIELLSPSNKPGGRDAERYQSKRETIIANDILFLELDYLHESPPTINGLPDYRISDEAHPYHIIVIDPRPTLQTGVVRVQGFSVDDPLPTINIPLNDDDVLAFDFNTPYHQTISDALYGLESVDYSQLPLNFEYYHPNDRQRIVNRMVAVVSAAQDHTDLETLEIQPADNSLDDALARLKNLV